jgi:hypothetical protein
LIKRSGIESAVIGVFEMDFEPKEQLWYPHFHLLVPKGNALDDFIERFKRSQKGTRSRRGKRQYPVKDQDLVNPVRQISYIFKYMWQQLAWKGHGGKRRLLDRQFCDYLKLVDHHGHRRLMFLYKTRLEGGVLKIKCP